MPHLHRLPAVVDDDELRVYWDVTAEGGDLHVFGSHANSGFVLSQFCQPRLQQGSNLGAAVRARMTGAVEDGPSFLKEMEARGYDPKTLVFSIRRKGATASQGSEHACGDLRGILESAENKLEALQRRLAETEEVKGLRVLSEDELDDITGHLQALADLITTARRQAPEE